MSEFVKRVIRLGNTWQGNSEDLRNLEKDLNFDNEGVEVVSAAIIGFLIHAEDRENLFLIWIHFSNKNPNISGEEFFKLFRNSRNFIIAFLKSFESSDQNNIEFELRKMNLTQLELGALIMRFLQKNSTK